MKPLNLDNRPCSPISSNCVIWQGDDITCIKLCAGDTVSDVVFALATELCTIMDQLNVSNYDLSCLGINSCPPADFQALIQLLIERICEASGTTTSKTETATCPDCVVSVAPCFVEGNQTTMQLVDYVQMIANRICSILDQISIINAQIADLLIRVTNLENTPAPAPVNPSFTLGCTIGSLPDGSRNFINVILQEFINNVWCNYVTATGSASDILAAVAAKCIADTDLQLATGTPFSTNPLWIQNASYSTLSDAVNNLWIALCDIRAAFEEASTSVVVGGEGITVVPVTVGSTTTYTVINDYLEVFTANVTINSTYAPTSGVIPKVLPSSVNGVQEGQPILKYNKVSSNSNYVVASTAVPGSYVPNASLPLITFGSFNNDTGLFTITDPGTYLINATIHLKPDNGSTVYWSGETSYSPTPTTAELRDNFNDIGSFYIGIHPDNNSDTFVAASQTLTPSIDRNIEVTASKVIVATNPTALRVKVLNTTIRDYDGRSYAGSDGILFSITKLRTGLNITNL